MKTKVLISALPLAIALLAPVSLKAQDHDRDDRHHIYDAHHHDYHDFDEHEDRAYRIYWQQRHRDYVDWDHASARQRQAYWDWRHNHSDVDLHIDIH